MWRVVTGLTLPEWLRLLFYKFCVYFDGLVQDCSNSIAKALELLQPCPKPSSSPWYCQWHVQYALGSWFVVFCCGSIPVNFAHQSYVTTFRAIISVAVKQFWKNKARPSMCLYEYSFSYFFSIFLFLDIFFYTCWFALKWKCQEILLSGCTESWQLPVQWMVKISSNCDSN